MNRLALISFLTTCLLMLFTHGRLLHVSIHRGSNTCYFILDLLQILLLTLSECKRIIKLLVPLKSSKNNKSLIVETKFGDDLFAFT